MNKFEDVDKSEVLANHTGSLEVVSRAELMQLDHWSHAFADVRKDRRYYEIVEDTLRQGFEYRYFLIRDETGAVRAIQPFFLHDQDLLAGMSPRIAALAVAMRRWWPRFMLLRTLMVGCAAGEGHLDASDDASKRRLAQSLAARIVQHAREMGAPLIVLKEFPATYRDQLACFLGRGFTRLPSLPMARLSLEYKSFEDYMTKALSAYTRKDLRRKFRKATHRNDIEMSVMTDITPLVDEIYALYLNVYERAQLRFEKLTKEYLCELGRRMPDKTRYFIWRRNHRIVAVNLCLIHGETICAEYIGLDYEVAFDLSLYFLVVRDVVAWAIDNGFKSYESTCGGYDPKRHLRFLLEPLDLYVRHTGGVFNLVLSLILPFIGPTRYEPLLEYFPEFQKLFG
jgi:predicted N-acyltransferase